MGAEKVIYGSDRPHMEGMEDPRDIFEDPPTRRFAGELSSSCAGPGKPASRSVMLLVGSRKRRGVKSPGPKWKRPEAWAA